ncbi:Aspartate aminotransferase [Thalassocella blandensis]|nr:Aspartate aminotransferase [Thalassocella blandensis]
MFTHLEALPADPLLGIIERFAKDTNPQKIDLGVGVYKDINGQTPILSSVKQAEAQLLDQQNSKAYLGARGDIQFAELMSELAFGQHHPALVAQRVAGLQTPGGCGALRVAAELLVRTKDEVTIWVSDPTWANHIPLLGSAGIQIKQYPYYDYDNKSIKFQQMLDVLQQIPEGDLVLLHACCHNPSGADLSQAQWQQVVDVLEARKIVPFIDMAYQGFGESLDDDAFGLRLVAERLPEAVFAVSCSKNFGLYRERVGVVGIITESASQVPPVISHLAQIVRGIYSMPPDHGAAIVRLILSQAELKQQWLQELQHMREQIQQTRESLVSIMSSLGHDQFGFVAQEKGMFSFLGITPQQVHRLAEESAIYLVDSSRINVAGLNVKNLPYFCESVAKIL